MGKKKRISAIEAELVIINYLQENYPKIRNKSKSPTFLLQFNGTLYGLMRIFGFSKDKAKAIVEAYESMYQVSIKWTKKKLKFAYKHGYVKGAFNLRLFTPMLKQVPRGADNVPASVKSEERTAGNMLSGQSYGILTLRAMSEFMKKTRKHKKWKYKIAPWATIYDSIYLEIPFTAEAIHYVNKNLIKEMKNIDGCPELKHDKVKMGADLGIFYPSWATETTIKNNTSLKEIEKVIKDLKRKK